MTFTYFFMESNLYNFPFIALYIVLFAIHFLQSCSSMLKVRQAVTQTHSQQIKSCLL